MGMLSGMEEYVHFKGKWREIFIKLTLFTFISVFMASGGMLHGENTVQESKKQRVFVIPIRGEINRALMVFLRRGIEQAKKGNADVILFDTNTFGGRVDSALQIASLIGSAGPALTVTHVTASPESTGVSWSAGALIAFATERIFMAPGTSMGAAAPIMMGPEGEVAASEKVVSAIRAQMAALAEKNGYPQAIARAMVDADIELLELYVDGELRVVSSDEIPEIERIAKKEGKSVEKGKVISSRGKLLTLTAGEMERYGVSSGTIEEREQVLARLGLTDPEVVVLEESAADKAVGFLTGSTLTGLLIMLGLIALFIEITTPGFGIPGTVAIICFAIVFSSYALLGTVGSLELILFVLGVVLLLLELFVIPGFGITGITGIVLIVASLVLSMQGFVLPQFEWQKGMFRRNLLVVSLSTVSAFAIFGILAYSLPQIKLFSRLRLEAAQSAEEGFTVQTREEEQRLIGKRGVAVTTLRPSGKAEIGDEIVYVETDGEFVEAGQSVEVIGVSGNRVIVRRC